MYHKSLQQQNVFRSSVFVHLCTEQRICAGESKRTNGAAEKLSPANNIRNNQRYTKKSVIIQMKLDERRG